MDGRYKLEAVIVPLFHGQSDVVGDVNGGYISGVEEGDVAKFK
jgi:hypothetical protein